jgi:hypothetical protein
MLKTTPICSDKLFIGLDMAILKFTFNVFSFQQILQLRDQVFMP